MNQDLRKLEVFTTGQAARACHISQQTIIRCFDHGALKGFRIPGSKFRRIPRDVLIQFMKDNGIPTDLVENVGHIKMLLCGISEQTCNELAQDENLEIEIADDDFTLGMKLKGFRPQIVVVSESKFERKAIGSLQRAVKAREELSKVLLVVVLENGTLDDTADLEATGTMRLYQGTVSTEQLCTLIEEARQG